LDDDQERRGKLLLLGKGALIFSTQTVTTRRDPGQQVHPAPDGRVELERVVAGMDPGSPNWLGPVTPGEGGRGPGGRPHTRGV